VLGLGGAVEALAPEEFRTAVISRAKEACDVYNA
jgi:hypothetical protein